MRRTATVAPAWPDSFYWANTGDTKGGALGGAAKGFWRNFLNKKQGAAGITTAAPYVAG
jgi:hypothetical protein